MTREPELDPSCNQTLERIIARGISVGTEDRALVQFSSVENLLFFMVLKRY